MRKRSLLHLRIMKRLISREHLFSLVEFFDTFYITHTQSLQLTCLITV